MAVAIRPITSRAPPNMTFRELSPGRVIAATVRRAMMPRCRNDGPFSLSLFVVFLFASHADSLLLRACFIDSAGLFDDNFRAVNGIFAVGQMLGKPILHSTTLGNSRVVVLATFGQNFVYDRLVVRQFADTLCIKWYSLLSHSLFSFSALLSQDSLLSTLSLW